MQPSNDPIMRLGQELGELKRLVRDALAAPFIVPVLAADPPETDPTNLWVLPDGRLRGRHLDPTGATWVYREWIATADTGGTSADPVAPPEPQPTAQENVYSASWWRSYRENGTGRADAGDRVYQGRSDAYNGRQRGLVGFDQAAIAADLAGATITGAWLEWDNLGAGFPTGAEYSIRLHDFDAAPGTWTGGLAEYLRAEWPATGTARASAGIGIAQGLRDGSASGFAVEAPNDSAEFYGIFDASSVRLIINFTA